MNKKQKCMIRGRFAYYRALIDDLYDRLDDLEIKYSECNMINNSLYDEIDYLKDEISMIENKRFKY